MSKVALVALARPTFDLTCAQSNFESARQLLKDLGAEVVGPTELIMTPEDVAKAVCLLLRSIFYLWPLFRMPLLLLNYLAKHLVQFSCGQCANLEKLARD